MVTAPDVDDDDDNTRENFWCHGEIIRLLVVKQKHDLCLSSQRGKVTSTPRTVRPAATAGGLLFTYIK